MEKTRLDKLKKIILFLIVLISVFFLGKHYTNIKYFIEKRELLGNIIDFLGNILIALTSAGIAFFVSKRESSLNDKNIHIKKIKERKGMLQLLKIENSFNISILDSTAETENLDEKIEILQGLTTRIWEDLRFKIDLSYGELEDISIAYYQIEISKNLTKSEIEADSNLIDDLRSLLNDLNDMVDDLIKKNKDYLSHS